MAAPATIKPVTVSLTDLKANNVPFSALLEAFGPSSLGILVVSDLPSAFSSLRTKVLSNSSRLAALPAPKLKSLTKESAKYLVGWSHGKETLRPGVVDTYKGSYYINCAFYKDPELQGVRDGAEKFPGFDEYTAENVWPSDEEVEGFKNDAEALIRLIIDTAVLVARACDRFAEQEIEGYQKSYLERMVQDSETTKARLLHYFPSNNQNTDNAVTDGAGHDQATTNGHQDDTTSLPAEDDWCATHLDHGCLTGLTSAMFLDESSPKPLFELPSSPSPSSGLYIRDRSDKTHKVSIPRDCLAFQTGEALELITQGKFKAVPHFVRGVDVNECGDQAARIVRNTLAVFTQPNLDEVVDVRNGLTFGEFARGVVKRNTAG
ncbi:hypothetical protein PMZ80_010093 [Knufia obscura]|uniref:Clavaminate synthase-like protein n=2 Tax=Knufia TaxID=430999 RepID=A0AAN8I5F1_9EURO|nr:hypothetical protein PMZ80_010093 [Knufia obscura]KAK5952834.1 hypothetical protein OHC33_005953 [Knufia fluminis]